MRRQPSMREHPAMGVSDRLGDRPEQDEAVIEGEALALLAQEKVEPGQVIVVREHQRRAKVVLEDSVGVAMPGWSIPRNARYSRSAARTSWARRSPSALPAR